MTTEQLAHAADVAGLIQLAGSPSCRTCRAVQCSALAMALGVGLGPLGVGLGPDPLRRADDEAGDQRHDQAREQAGHELVPAAPAGSRSADETRRARIGRSSRNRRRSSASSPAVGYRRAGSLAIALRTIVSRSRGIRAVELARRRRLVVRDLLDQLQPGRPPRTPAAASAARRASAPARRRRSAGRTGPGTAPAPCSAACRRCRRCAVRSSAPSALARPKSVTQTRALRRRAAGSTA